MQLQNQADPKVVIVSGPSGVGKSTICKETAKRLDAYLSVSVTTRPKAPKEADGIDYWFVSKDEFQQTIKQNQFLEYAEVFGNFYGTSRDKVQQAMKDGKIVILEIDVQGALQVKEQIPEVLMIFVLPPTQAELAHRIEDRGRDAEKAVEKRLNGAGTEIAAAWQHYEHMVINDDLDQAVNEVVQIIQGHFTGEGL